MPGYDDINGGMPPDPFAAYPQPAWLPNAAALPPPPPPDPSPGAPAFGPQPDGSYPYPALPPAPPDPTELAAIGLPPPPLTEEPIPGGTGVPDAALPAQPGATEPAGPPAPPMPWGAAPAGAPDAPDVPAFGPQLPTTVAGSGLVETPTIEQKTAEDPFEYSMRPADPTAVLPSLQEAKLQSPFDGLTDAEAFKKAESLSPVEFARLQSSQEAAKATKLALDKAKADADNLTTLKRDLADRQKADDLAREQSNKIVADAVALSKRPLDRGRWFSNLSTFQKVMAGIAAITGGLLTKPGGPNLGVDFVTKHIDDDINDQKANIENERTGIQARQGAVADEFKRSGNLYEAAEKVRLATYAAVIDKMQTDQQLFDPRGTQFLEHGKKIQAMQAAFGKKAEELQKEKFKQNVEGFKAVAEAGRDAEVARHNRATEEAALLKANGKGGAGEGSATNPNYTVASGWFNPFDPTQPIMGKRTIGGKGEDAKERKVVDDEIKTYTHVQDYWAKLAHIGATIDYHKSLGETAWAGFKSTDAAEYDAAKHALVVYLTRELGDKLTQGQLDAQSHRIPDRAALFESREPGKQIRDAQADADRDFARDMDLIGLDASPIIRGAQQYRATITPTATQELDAAQAALAANPGNKDAQAALDAAGRRQRDEVAADKKRTADIAEASKLGPALEPLHEEPDRPVDETSLVREANRAIHTYRELQKKFINASDATDHLKGLKRPGDVAAANREHDLRVGELARETIQARTLAETLADKAHAETGKNSRKNWVETRARASNLGFDPDAPAVNPANPLIPDRSFVPGADPFAIAEPVSVPKPKARKR